MNKPLTLIGIILICIGGIGAFYVLEFLIAAIIGIVMGVVGISVGAGRFKRSLGALDSATEFCPNCGSNIKRGSSFCPYCRVEL